MNKPEVKYWKIIFMPPLKGSGVVEWVFKGNEKDLDTYLTNNGCCELCREEILNGNFDSWWHSNCSAEYSVEDVTEEYL